MHVALDRPSLLAVLALGGALLSVLVWQLGATTTLLAAVKDMGKQLDDHGKQLDDHGKQLADHGKQLADYGMLLGALGETVLTLAEAAVTPAVGARLEACGRSSVVYSLVLLASGKIFKQCSAVPIPGTVAAAHGQPPGASSSTYFLTSAHCFMDGAEPVAALANISYRRRTYACSLLDNFAVHPHEPSLDLAIVRCPDDVPISPTKLSAMPYAAHAPAAIVGFTRGWHHDLDMTAGGLGDNNAVFALHTKVAHLSSSFPTPDFGGSGSAGGDNTGGNNPGGNNAGSGNAGGGSAGGGGAGGGGTGGGGGANGGFVEDGVEDGLTTESSQSSSGYIDLSPLIGMSGGAVFDMHCGVFGITERRSHFGWGGSFVRLVPGVLRRISRAIRAGAFASA